MTFSLSSTFLCIALILAFLIYKVRASPAVTKSEEEVAKMSRLITELREITGISQADAKILAKKHKTLEGAIEAFYSDPGMQSRASMGSYSSNGKSGGGSSSVKNQEKKLGEIWERFKDESNPRLITIEGTMELCQELDIDPESDVVLFCLASDLGSKTTGEWEKGPFVSGWASMPGNIDSIEGMKARLPELRRQLYSDSVYFKKVYMHTFDLAKAEGSRTLGLETALSLWPIFVKPALESSPSALSHIPAGSPPNTRSTDPPQFTSRHFDQWIDFQTKKNKAVSKDTWNLFVDFMRSIDSDFKQYDEAAAWPSTIDDFVDYVRSQ